MVIKMKKGFFISVEIFQSIFEFLSTSPTAQLKKIKIGSQIYLKTKLPVLIFMTLKNPNISI